MPLLNVYLQSDDDETFNYSFEGQVSEQAFNKLVADMRTFFKLPELYPKTPHHGMVYGTTVTIGQPIIGHGFDKIKSIKAVRCLSNMGLKDAKDFVEGIAGVSLGSNPYHRQESTRTLTIDPAMPTADITQGLALLQANFVIVAVS